MTEKEFNLSLGQLEVNFRLKTKSKEEGKVNLLSSQDLKSRYLQESFSLPLIPAEYQPHLRNVAASVASKLKEANPSTFGEVDTDNAEDIPEARPEESLRELLNLKGVNPENLSLRLVKDFGAGDLSLTQRLQLAEKVERELNLILDKGESSRSKARK